MKKTVVFDLDGTLADVEHRVHFVQGAVKNWAGFNSNIPNDLPHRWCTELLKAMKAQGYEIVIVTGRGFENDQVTREWLAKHQISFDAIFYRALGDQREDDLVKEEIYQRDLKPYYDVLFVVEDRKRVVELWRRLGITCLQCAVGDF